MATNPKTKSVKSTGKIAKAAKLKPVTKSPVTGLSRQAQNAPKAVKTKVLKGKPPKASAKKVSTAESIASKLTPSVKVAKSAKQVAIKKLVPISQSSGATAKAPSKQKLVKKDVASSSVKLKVPIVSVPKTTKAAESDGVKSKTLSVASKVKTVSQATAFNTTSPKKMGTLASHPKATPAVIDNGPPTDPKILAKIRGMQSDQEKRKDYAQPPTAKPMLIHSNKLSEQARDPAKDRLILMVRDPYWLHACWDITRRSVERAKAALSGHWHAAKPILRLLRTDDNSTTSNTESVFRDIVVHGGVRNWYIDVEDPKTTFRILLGYLFANGRFHELARSNPVTTPVPGSSDATDDHWADIATDAERIYALSGGYDEESTQIELQQMMQEKLKRPVGTPAMSQFGSGAEGSLKRSKNFHFTLDAEMVVFGATPANAYVTLNGEPIKIRSDGTYSARVPLPNNRQVMAATSKSRDGLDEQTIVIAVERNTKIMEPLSLTEPDLD